MNSITKYFSFFSELIAKDPPIHDDDNYTIRYVGIEATSLNRLQTQIYRRVNEIERAESTVAKLASEYFNSKYVDEWKNTFNNRKLHCSRLTTIERPNDQWYKDSSAAWWCSDDIKAIKSSFYEDFYIIDNQLYEINAESWSEAQPFPTENIIQIFSIAFEKSYKNYRKKLKLQIRRIKYRLKLRNYFNCSSTRLSQNKRSISSIASIILDRFKLFVPRWLSGISESSQGSYLKAIFKFGNCDLAKRGNKKWNQVKVVLTQKIRKIGKFRNLIPELI